mgnify:CR=1 FL=1
MATPSAVIVRRGTVRVSLENRSEMTKRKRFPCSVFGSGPKMSMATKSRGSLAGNNFRKLVLFLSVTRFF